jgi:hypothetical protein
MDSFKSPNRCFHRFKGRNNVGCKTVSGESGSFCQEYTDQLSDGLQPALKQGFKQTDILMQVKQYTPMPYCSTAL